MKLDLQSRAADAIRLTERVEYLEEELQKVLFVNLLRSVTCFSFSRSQHVSLSQEYELQLSNMNRSVQRNEEIIKKLQADKQSYSNELSNLRDLNSTIENKKDQIIRQLTSREIENEQLQSMIGDMKVEIDLLRTQIHNEKSMVQSLEEIIGSLREKEFQAEIHVQERTSDLQLAKDRVNLGDLKL